jgi:hypothetical protein
MARLKCNIEKKKIVKIAIGREIKNKIMGEIDKNRKLSST